MNIEIIVCELKSTASAQGLTTDSCEHGNKLSASMKNVKFLEQLSDCQLLNKKSAT
jgi:hypothetical protein